MSSRISSDGVSASAAVSVNARIAPPSVTKARQGSAWKPTLGRPPKLPTTPRTGSASALRRAPAEPRARVLRFQKGERSGLSAPPMAGAGRRDRTSDVHSWEGSLFGAGRISRLGQSLSPPGSRRNATPHQTLVTRTSELFMNSSFAVLNTCVTHAARAGRPNPNEISADASK